MRKQDYRSTGRIPVNFEVTTYSEGVETLGWANNLSFEGMQVVEPVAWARPGDDVRVRFRLPEEEWPMACHAVVVYANDGVFGLRFTDIPPTWREDLEGFVATKLAGAWFAS